ncbi:AaceriAGR150Cp [[Ashbya] aceris (nom. inval.)]|nr:AaceriAGR150Cp [[Ashbya] aceris (nom. inval.)]
MGLSIEQKYNICLMAERHPRWTQLELARWAYEVYQLPKCPSQGTISRLLAKKAVFLNSKEHEKDANRLRKPNNLLVRRILQEWTSQSIWNRIPVTSPILQDTAQSIWHRIPPEMREGNGSFSYKWITHLLSKMDISVDQELPKPPKIWTFEERSELKRWLAQLPPKNLFTLDETFLAYNLPLCFEQYESSDIRRRVEVITVMLCANMDGSEKLHPMVIGRYENYQSFRSHFPPEGNTSQIGRRPSSYANYHGVRELLSAGSDALPTGDLKLGEQLAQKYGITYHSNRKSWLTSNIFHDWLSTWDKRLVVDNRKIWIILDDSCSHRLVNLHLKNIELVYTSVSSSFLPFNWGVLDEFKAGYRIQQYKALIDLQENIARKNNGIKPLLSHEQSALTISNAFKFIKLAWEAIPSDTIKANWKASGILPPEMINLTGAVSMAFKKNEVLEAKLNYLCQKFYCLKKWDYEMLLDLNIENKNTNFLSSEEIIESAIVDPWEPEEVDLEIEREEQFDPINVSTNSVPLPDGNETFSISNFSQDTGFPLNNELHSDRNPLGATISYTNEDGVQNRSFVSDNVHRDGLGRRATVSELIDRNDDFFVNSMQQDIVTDQLLQDMFDLPSNSVPVPPPTENSELSVPSVVQLSEPSRGSPQDKIRSPPFDHVTSASSTASTVGGTTLQNNAEDKVDIALGESSMPFTPENIDTDELDHYISSISNNPPNSLNNERLIMLTTLQTNIEIAKAMASILKHAEVREVGLSENALNEMRSSYSNCLKKIRNARHLLNSDTSRKRRRVEQHSLGDTVMQVPKSVVPTTTGSLQSDDTVFPNSINFN